MRRYWYLLFILAVFGTLMIMPCYRLFSPQEQPDMSIDPSGRIITVWYSDNGPIEVYTNETQRDY